MTPEEPSVLLRAAVPDALIVAFLQAIRDFDAAHEGECQFNIMISTPHLSVTEVNAMLDQITPEFANRETFRKQ